MDPFFTILFLGQPLWMWLGFATIVAVLLAFDLGVLHRGSREIGARESLITSCGGTLRPLRLRRPD